MVRPATGINEWPHIYKPLSRGVVLSPVALAPGGSGDTSSNFSYPEYPAAQQVASDSAPALTRPPSLGRLLPAPAQAGTRLPTSVLPNCLLTGPTIDPYTQYRTGAQGIRHAPGRAPF